MSNVWPGIDPEWGPPDPPALHPSHTEIDEVGCSDCGATTDRDLALPCANKRCRRCGELNGLRSPGCPNHGEI